MKRTNIVIDESLFERTKKATGIPTTRELVDHAVRELFRHQKQRGLLKLRGKVDWKGDLSAMRRERSFT
ncbi:MAG: type II toxin-antitoxin system VapB family antitoxin [Planctomycetota bacterium]|nr:type II toxin-antitoxin system VapB family antitoxin [Planctomycetota bacterium]